MATGRTRVDVHTDEDMPSFNAFYRLMVKYPDLRERYHDTIEALPFAVQAEMTMLGERFERELRVLFNEGLSDKEAGDRLGVTAMTCNKRTKAWREYYAAHPDEDPRPKKEEPPPPPPKRPTRVAKPLTNKSGARGVKQERDAWTARIMVNKTRILIGRYATREEASAAYERAAREAQAMRAPAVRTKESRREALKKSWETRRRRDAEWLATLKERETKTP
jgi:hypothetical protein